MAFDKLLVDKQGNPKKRYLAKASDCKNCPLSEPCKGKKASEKRLHHTAYKAHYERMLNRLSSRFGKRMMRIRSATVEPILGSLINYYGLRQINTRSREAAAKVMYIAAMAYNLKKYLRFTPVEQSGMLIALPIPDQFCYILIYFCNSHGTYTTEMQSRESIELWKKNVYECIEDISDLESQKDIWLGNSSEFESSFDEYMMSLFDDFDIILFIQRENWPNTMLPESLRVAIKQLSTKLDAYQKKATDAEILEDPMWQAVTKEAKTVVQNWDSYR